MVIAEGDHLAVANAAFEAFDEANEPKELVTLDGGHFDTYVDALEKSSTAAQD